MQQSTNGLPSYVYTDTTIVYTDTTINHMWPSYRDATINTQQSTEWVYEVSFVNSYLSDNLRNTIRHARQICQPTISHDVCGVEGYIYNRSDVSE